MARNPVLSAGQYSVYPEIQRIIEDYWPETETRGHIFQKEMLYISQLMLQAHAPRMDAASLRRAQATMRALGTGEPWDRESSGLNP